MRYFTVRDLGSLCYLTSALAGVVGIRMVRPQDRLPQAGDQRASTRAVEQLQRAELPRAVSGQRLRQDADRDLPPPSYAELPGWLVVYAVPPGSTGTPRPPEGVAGGRIGIFPRTDAWGRAPRGTQLMLVTPAGNRALSFRGAVERAYVTELEVQADQPTPTTARDAPLWLLPASKASMARFTPVEARLSNDRVRTWITEGATLTLSKTGRLTAELVLEPPGTAPVLLEGVEMRLHHDSVMGVFGDTALDIRVDWRVPRPTGAFRFSPQGPLVIVIEAQGYECQNWRVVLLNGAEVRRIESPRYAMCAT